MKKSIFSVHEKHQVHRLSSIQEAVGLLSDTLQLLCGNENNIRSKVVNLPKLLNGPQGNVASKTAASIKILLKALKNFQQVSELYRYDALNWLSCMTVDLKTWVHLVVHHKDKIFKVLDYPRNLGNAAKEGLMGTTYWVGYYFTNPNSWYPVR